MPESTVSLLLLRADAGLRTQSRKDSAVNRRVRLCSYYRLKPQVSPLNQSTSDHELADKWLLVFKPTARIEKLQDLCFEAEHSTQGRFNGTCGRLHSGSLLQAISGVISEQYG